MASAFASNIDDRIIDLNAETAATRLLSSQTSRAPPQISIA